MGARSATEADEVVVLRALLAEVPGVSRGEHRSGFQIRVQGMNVNSLLGVDVLFQQRDHRIG